MPIDSTFSSTYSGGGGCGISKLEFPPPSEWDAILTRENSGLGEEIGGEHNNFHLPLEKRRFFPFSTVLIVLQLLNLLIFFANLCVWSRPPSVTDATASASAPSSSKTGGIPSRFIPPVWSVVTSWTMMAHCVSSARPLSCSLRGGPTIARQWKDSPNSSHTCAHITCGGKSIVEFKGSVSRDEKKGGTGWMPF